MKHYKLLTFTFSLFALTHASAQETPKEEKKGDKKVIIIKKTHDSSELKDTIEIFFNGSEPKDSGIGMIPARKIPGIINTGEFNMGFANVNHTDERSATVLRYDYLPELNNAKSLHFGFGQNWAFNLVKGKVRFWTGVRYDIHNYRFKNSNVRLAHDEKMFRHYFDSTGTSNKSKVVVNYIGIPLSIGYQSNPYDEEDGFFIRAGVNAGYLVRVHSKVKYDNGGKDKEFDDFNFNNFNISPFICFGYNNVGIYARMSTTPLFASNQGADATSFQFGLILQ